MKINKTWHERNRMPRNATTEQRLQWHRQHQKHCGCRPIPEGLKRLLGRKKRTRRDHRSGPATSFTRRDKVLATLRRHKRSLQEQYKVKELGIFGSYVRGEQRKSSDVDIVIDFEQVPDLITFIQIEDTLGGILRRKVDLVDKQGIRSQLREGILNEVVYV